MIVDLSQVPPGTKVLPVLPAHRIKRKSSLLEGYPSTHQEMDTYPISQEPSEGFLRFCWRLVKTCVSDGGIGLAAPQVGVFKRMVVIKEEGEGNLFRILIHPSWKPWKDSDQERGPEGCLSVPGKVLEVSRFKAIEATWFEYRLKDQLVMRTEILRDFRARVFQHEVDHLDGVSILDRTQT